MVTNPAASSSRAVVIVSGGDAISPFTTPDRACSTGLAAGNTDTALREYLLAKGHAVYTSPAMNARGPVVEQLTGFGPFGGMPFELPEHLTVNSTGDIDLAGEHLARFLGLLHSDYGVDTVDLVAHSMGGLFSRAAIRVLKATASPIRVRSLTTLGTPWQGAIVSDYAVGDVDLSVCAGDQFSELVVQEFKKRADSIPVGAAQEVARKYLTGPGGWNEFQAGVLDDIPVTLIAGSRFEADGSPEYWPNDGLVSPWSALATEVPAAVLPHRRTLTFARTHSIFISDAAGLDWNTALTWDPEVLEAVHEAIETAAI
jgi:pimeloyl-ACP methyl ester carboxylesterase